MDNSFLVQTRGLVADIRSRYGWRIGALVALMSVIALIEGLGMALLLPLLNTVGILGPAGGAVMNRLLSSVLTAVGTGTSAFYVAGVLIVVSAIELLLVISQGWWVAWLQRDYWAYWQRRLFDSFVHAEWSFFAGEKLGHLTNLIMQETARLAGAFLILMQVAATAIVTLVYLLVALSISWQATGLILAVVPLLVLAVRRIGRRNYQIGLRLGPLTSDLNVLVTEFLAGAKLIKATATEEVAIGRVKHVVDDLNVQHTLATFLPSLVKAIFEFSALSALCLILVFGAQGLAIPAARILVVLGLFLRLLPRFNSLQQNVHSLATYVPAYAIVRRVLDSAEAVSERHRYGSVDAVRDARLMSGPLKINIVRGGYRGVTILRDIELELPERGLVGIIGESGGGKSTLVNCLLGLGEIEIGTLAFGNFDLARTPLNVWRRQIGYVPQDTVLFHLSIRDNIAWGMPEATDEEVANAARQALAHDFILEQPQGYLTIVGDQGMRLSGGQRQRLCIARALLTRPRLLVMDEATNALDATSEASVLETVNHLRKDICVVMVAHRLATIRGAEMIVVMDNGRIVDRGNWQDLGAMREAMDRTAVAEPLE